MNVVERDNCSPLWRVARDNPKLLVMCKTILNSFGNIISRQFLQVCKLCNCSTDNLTVHKICHYHVLEKQRQDIWTCLYECVGPSEYSSFTQLDDFKQCVHLLKLITCLLYVYVFYCKMCLYILLYLYCTTVYMFMLL